MASILYTAARALVGQLVSKDATYSKAYNFYVEFNRFPTAFTRVSGLENSISIEPFNEGGNNRGSLFLTGPQKGDHTATFEYGAALGSESIDALTPGKYLDADVIIMVLGDGTIKYPKVYMLNDCYVRSVHFGDLDASRSAIMINNVEISYRDITVMNDLF